MPIDFEEIPLQNAGDLLPQLQPLINTIQPFISKLYILVGGLFGLYLILIIARVYYERKKVHLLKDIRYDLDRLNMHYGVSYSKQKKGIFGNLITKFKKYLDEKKVEKHYKKKEKK